MRSSGALTVVMARCYRLLRSKLIPLNDLRRQYLEIQTELEIEVLRVLRECHYVLGPEVAAFEREFAGFCGVEHAVGCNSGTSALHLALLAAGIGAGDEVITTPYTFIATTAAIRYTGAKPVFVDIDPATLNIDVSRIEAAITERTKAILPVHLFGHPADMDPIMETARRHNLTVIEDAAQAHGAEYKGRRVGTIGDFGCFSFYPGKNLGAAGEGGIVTTGDAGFARTMRMLRDWGTERRYHHVLRGYNYRLEALQAAVLRVKLRRLPAWTEARRAHAASYSSLLAHTGLVTPQELPGCKHVYNVYAVLSDARDAIVGRLDEAGIQTTIYYPIPIHLAQAHADLGLTCGMFPIAERTATREFSLPIFPHLETSEIEKVARAVRGAAG